MHASRLNGIASPEAASHDRAGRLEPFHHREFDFDEPEDELPATRAAFDGEDPATVVGGCPHVDRNDARCSHRFSLGRLEQAFNVCFGSYHTCPLYHRLGSEVDELDQPCRRVSTLVEVRVLASPAATAAHSNSRSLASQAALRQTGT